MTAPSLATCAKCFISKRRKAAGRALHTAIDHGAGSGRVLLGEARDGPFDQLALGILQDG
jgi:hypothetical protein